MDLDTFWTLIADNVKQGGWLDTGPLEQALAALNEEDIIAFDEHLRRLLKAAYSWDIWGAAYITNGGCSDDGFEYFRGWLVARGRAAYERVLADPDSLVEFAEGECEAEEILYVARCAYEERTGEEMPFGSPVPWPDLGEEWDFDDLEECRRRLRRLSAKFIDG